MGNCLDYCKPKNERYEELLPISKYKDSLTENYDLKTKMILLGETNVGKTSILKALVKKDNHLENYPTIGVDFDFVMIQDDDICFKICVWDTAGNPQYKVATQTYFKTSKIFCLVYDVTDKITFDKLPEIIYDIKQLTNQQEDNLYILVANKVNLHQKRVIGAIEGNAFAREHNCYYVEINDNAEQTYTTFYNCLKIVCNKFYAQDITEIREKSKNKKHVKNPNRQLQNANIIYNNASYQEEIGCFSLFDSTRNVVSKNARISTNENGVSYEPL